MDKYKVTVWDKKANDPYYVLEYDDRDTAQEVARNMKRHYIEDWGEHAESYYQIMLQRIPGE